MGLRDLGSSTNSAIHTGVVLTSFYLRLPIYAMATDKKAVRPELELMLKEAA